MKKILIASLLVAGSMLFIGKNFAAATAKNTDRPSFAIASDGTVSIRGAQLIGASQDYLGIQIFGINQNVMIDPATTLTLNGATTPLTVSAVGQSGEVDITGVVDPTIGFIKAKNVRAVGQEMHRATLIETQLNLLQIELVQLLEMQVKALTRGD